ncbi:TIGR04222 domain-containing membrane protein [Micromonospora acroterricola]|uniref:TIGR04222 domain-containing membrane protein n=1 Tax=Micromonospora acroterricola TaxID=2202421 RepID=A0A317CSK8_9ACTN|nr:TIGR04222 domain-containing membrane protein [Micromonospora acroterricola]PWR05152.1 TIGR04222 domain-containing membrane protein [Micromonospora acroterricola]
MIDLAASGDTWGIPGPTFLRLYLVATALVVALAVYYRVRPVGDSRDATTGPLGPQQVAYLNGGPRLAVHAAVGGLRSSGAIGVGPDRRLLTTGPTPSGLTPLDQAIHWAAHQRARAGDLPQDQRVREALDQLRAGLEQRGLLRSRAQHGTARRWAGFLFVLLGIGLFRLVSGLFNDRPVGYLMLALIPVLIAALLLRLVPERTRAGRAAVRDIRRQHAHLAPASSPAFATYGAAGAAMGVALYGTASLWALDPGFAEQAEIQRQAASGSGWSSGSSGGTSGDGGGSSCSGGSSCGGGGGCGGGGCGG